MQLNYQIIATIDIAKEAWQTINSVKPELFKKRSLFTVTETEVEEPEYYKLHRKYLGFVSPEQLAELYEDIGYVSTCQTMGALTFSGLLPAVSWDTDTWYDGYSLNLYVTPIPYEAQEEEFLKALDWLPEDQREIKIAKMQSRYNDIMEVLLNPEDYDIPSRIEEVNTDQLEMMFN